MEKSAHLLGMGYESVVKVPVDSHQKMDFTALKSLVEKDIADGNLPFCVVATIGTTDFGSMITLKKYNAPRYPELLMELEKVYLVPMKKEDKTSFRANSRILQEREMDNNRIKIRFFLQFQLELQ